MCNHRTVEDYILKRYVDVNFVKEDTLSYPQFVLITIESFSLDLSYISGKLDTKIEKSNIISIFRYLI
jgi:hypothetical protein